MKQIEKNNLIKLIQKNISDGTSVSINRLKILFDIYGDDWFVIDGIYKLCTKNDRILNLLNEIKIIDKEIHNLLKFKNDETTIFTNKELKMIDDYIKELESYKYNMDRDYLRLKKENKILRENAEHNDKVVDKVNWENLKLKKQLEEYKRLGFKYLNDKCNKLENQQKEFIEWLTNEANINPYDISDYTYEDIINTILSKYYEIIEK